LRGSRKQAAFGYFLPFLDCSKMKAGPAWAFEKV
jgi:hypothetical protein